MKQKPLEVIPLVGRIDEKLLKSFLFEYEKKNSAKHIFYFIESRGGFVDSAIEIARYMNTSEIPMTTIAGKYVDSAAFFLHQCSPGDRIAYSDTTFLLHRHYKKNGGELISLEEHAREQMIFNVMAVVSGKKIEEIYALANKETIFTAKQAKEEGFVTKIINSPAPSRGVFFMLKCVYEKTSHYHPPRNSRLPRYQQASRFGGSW